MVIARPYFSAGLLAAQLVVAGIGLGGLGLVPPERGRILLVPLDGTSRDAAATLATRTGALVLAPGPLPGSLVVDASRAALAHATRGRAVLLVAAPRGACTAR